MHALNNGIGGSFFNATDFQKAACAMCQELTMDGVCEQVADHIHASGWYSIALMVYVFRWKIADLTLGHETSMMLDVIRIKPCFEELRMLFHPDVIAIIVNIGSHWIAIKSYDSRIWCLDSVKAGPIEFTMMQLISYVVLYKDAFLLYDGTDVCGR
jgi:hypothetical protein